MGFHICERFLILILAGQLLGCASEHSWRTQAGAGPEAVLGNTKVSGYAFSISKDGTLYTCVGKPVRLFPKTDETTKFINNIRTFEDMDLMDMESATIRDLFNSLPADAIRKGQTVYGFAKSEFQFDHVAPGDYYIYFQSGPAIRPSDAEVTVVAGQDLTEIKVARKNMEPK